MKAELTLDLNNAAFEGDRMNTELADTLRRLATSVLTYHTPAHDGLTVLARDINGNTVGRLLIYDEDDERCQADEPDYSAPTGTRETLIDDAIRWAQSAQHHMEEIERLGQIKETLHFLASQTAAQVAIAKALTAIAYAQ